MKFSFILLAHNEELTIKEEIENLYNKIIKNFSHEFEVIICEDGSADNTQKIIQETKNYYSFTHLTSKNRKGVSKAMVDAFRVAKGDYIFFTDAGKKFDFKPGSAVIFNSNEYHMGEPPAEKMPGWMRLTCNILLKITGTK